MWRCVSCHDVVCAAHCSHTKLQPPRYKSSGRDAEKVNNKIKIKLRRDGKRVQCVCCAGFVLRCIIFLNGSALSR